MALADGVHARNFKGAGVVVAHGGEKGLVLTDRNTAPIATVDVLISFAAHPTEARGCGGCCWCCSGGSASPPSCVALLPVDVVR